MAIVVAGIVAGCSPTTQPSATPTASAVASSSPSTALPSGSPPTPSPSAAASCADRTFAALTETQRIGQLFMVGLKKDQLDSALEAAIAGSHFGSVAFTKQTAVGVAAVRALTDAVQALATRAATGRIGFFVRAEVYGLQPGPTGDRDGPGADRSGRPERRVPSSDRRRGATRPGGQGRGRPAALRRLTKPSPHVPKPLVSTRIAGHTRPDGASRAEPRSGAHAAGLDGAKGNWLPRDGSSGLLRRAARA